MGIRIATTDDDIQACFPVMRQLRTKCEPDAFLAQVRRQQEEGYRLAMLTEGDDVVAVAGFRLGENLAWGRYLYVDDLVTDAARRAAGHGREILEWLVQVARDEGCDEVHLDSGVQRYDAHRFYLHHGLFISSHHFRRNLRPAK